MAVEFPEENFDLPHKPLLSQAEVVALAKRIREGDTEARNRLVEANLRLVHWLVSTYHKGSFFDREDLVQIGGIGLIKAADRYDWERGLTFSTYAYWWIRQAISNALADESRIITIPRGLQQIENQFNQTEEILAMELGRRPTFYEVIDNLGISQSRAEQLLKSRQQIVSLSSTVGESEDLLVEDLLAATDQTDQEATENLANEELRNLIYRTLSDRELLVIELAFGLQEDGPKNLEDIGKVLGVTRERIRQIKEASLAKLKKALTNYCPVA